MSPMSPAADRSEHDLWLGVEVRHLAALRAVAEEGTFGAAALRLGYAQSAISQQIAALERYVGHRLFDRPGGSRPVQLTRAGELLLGHAETIMSRLVGRADRPRLARRRRLRQPDPHRRLPERRADDVAADPAGARRRLRRRSNSTSSESNDDRMLLELLERGELDVAFAELPLPEGRSRRRGCSRIRTS